MHTTWIVLSLHFNLGGYKMDAWNLLGITLGLLSWTTAVIGLIYWINRAKRAEAEREELRDDLRGVASLLAEYHNSYYGRTKEALKEIVSRLSTASPRFAEFFTFQGEAKE
jgi:hypothetical protein